ncbi:unnamed protein product, partial [Allacma fusca]
MTEIAPLRDPPRFCTLPQVP